MASKKILLDEEEIPKQWYNIQPDLPKPLPPMIHPGTKEPVKLPPPLFPLECLKQEYSMERWIDIPEPVREVYRVWRPSPLFRATGLEKALKTPAKIYYKYEGVSPPGSHKTNTAVAQAYYAAKEGLERVTTETGAGQWGSALSYSAQLFGIKATVYMVSASYHQKPYRKTMIETWGAEVFPSPTNRTNSGRAILESDPESTGSLGIAISEAVEEALNTEGVKYTIGSVVNHVLLHQTVIGLETQKQLAMVDDYPDQVIGCIGGGSSFSGLFWPFYHDKVKGKAPKEAEFIAVESSACPKVTRGYYTYDHGDTAKIIPLVKMHTVGHTFIPAPIHAGGFDAAKLFAQTEGIIPAPEPAHAIKAAIDEAVKCKETGEAKTILFLLCGHGHFDMKAYDDYNHGRMLPYEYPQAKVDEAMMKLKQLYPWLNDELTSMT
jgi:tryptophan synthase beta chain